MLKTTYEQVLGAGMLSKLKETEQNYTYLTERHVQAFWFEQKYFKKLATIEGKNVEVFSPGIWNMSKGPDFQKAHIRIGDKELFGDIEIHLTEESWYQHHHHIDPSYDSVILHVSFFQPRNPMVILTSKGNQTPQLFLEHSLTHKKERLCQLVDLNLYPYKHFIGSGRCSGQLFESLPDDEIILFFKKAADWRLRKKREFFMSRIEDSSNFVHAGIAMALGYKNNSEAFLSLLLEMQNMPLQSEEERLSWLMAKTQFFDEPYFSKWKNNPYYLYLKHLSEKFDTELKCKLHLVQIRPLNHPIRRFAYMAKLVCDETVKTLIADSDLLWQAESPKKKWNKLLGQLEDMIPSYNDNYWNKRFLFEDHARNELIPFIGRDLKREIIINTVFPFLKEKISCRNKLESKLFDEFYGSLSTPKIGKSKYLTHRFFGDSNKGKILDKVYTAQGAYQLHYDFCVHFESSCEGCPFVERYKAMH